MISESLYEKFKQKSKNEEDIIDKYSKDYYKSEEEQDKNDDAFNLKVLSDGKYTINNNSIYSKVDNNLKSKFNFKQNPATNNNKDNIEVNLKLEAAFNLFTIYSKRKSIKSINDNFNLLKSKCFYKLILFIENNIKFPKTNHYRNNNKYYNNNNNHLYFSTLSDRIETSSEAKEREELKNCTFKPKISNFKFSSDNFNKFNKREGSQDIFERLHSEREIKDNKKRINQLTYEYNTTQTFSPNMSLTASSNQRLNSHNNNLSFIERQLNYSNIKENRKEQMKLKMEDNFDKVYSFSPKLLNNNRKYLNKELNANSILNSKDKKYYYKYIKLFFHLV